MKKELIDVPRLSKGIQKHLKQSGYTDLKLSEVQQAVSKSLGFNNLHNYTKTAQTSTGSVISAKDHDCAISSLTDKMKTTLNYSFDFILDFVSSELGMNLEIPEKRQSIMADKNPVLSEECEALGSGFVSEFSDKLTLFYFNNSDKIQILNKNIFLFDQQNIDFFYYHLFYSIKYSETMEEYKDLRSLTAFNKTISLLKDKSKKYGGIFIENFPVKLIYALNIAENKNSDINALFDSLIDLDIYLFNFFKSNKNLIIDEKFIPARLFHTSTHFRNFSFSYHLYQHLYNEKLFSELQEEIEKQENSFTYFLDNISSILNKIKK